MRLYVLAHMTLITLCKWPAETLAQDAESNPARQIHVVLQSPHDSTQLPAALRAAIKARLAGVLKDPESLRITYEVGYAYDEGAKVCGRFNAKNGFGGYVGFKWYEVIAALSGGKWTVVLKSPDALALDFPTEYLEADCGLTESEKAAELTALSLTPAQRRGQLFAAEPKFLDQTGGSYVGHRRTKMLFATTCAAARLIPVPDRRYFRYEGDALKQHYTPYAGPGC